MRTGWRKVPLSGKITIRGEAFTSPHLTRYAGKEVYLSARVGEDGFIFGFVVSASNMGGETLGLFEFSRKFPDGFV